MCGSTRRLLVRPGPATTHGHRSQALPSLTATPPVIPNVQLTSEFPVIRGYVERYTFSTGFVIHFPPMSVSRPPAPRPGNAGGPRGALWNTSTIAAHGLHGPAHLPWYDPSPMRWPRATWGSGASCPSRYTKSPQPSRVCGLAWNSGGAGIRSVAVGLDQVLGVGELVELIDVSLGNHDVDGREHE